MPILCGFRDILISMYAKKKIPSEVTLYLQGDFNYFFMCIPEPYHDVPFKSILILNGFPFAVLTNDTFILHFSKYSRSFIYPVITNQRNI